MDERDHNDYVGEQYTTVFIMTMQAVEMFTFNCGTF